MGIQIYDQVSILRSWSKAKLDRAVFLGFGLKESKITLNIMNVGEHCSKVKHLKISIIRNFSKVNHHHDFLLGLGLKVVKIAWNIAKVRVHACLSNWLPNLSSSCNS